jgi:undecaprenyl-diphosphatase
VNGLVATALDLDRRLLYLAAPLAGGRGVREVMRLASRLGDGPLWFGCGALALLLGGDEGRRLALEGLLAATLNALIYRAARRRVLRPRPYRALADLPLPWAPPSDGSFPSGHSLHAFASATLIALHFPLLAIVALPLAALIAASRVLLAVHYPSDVVAGALIGALVAAGIAAAL